MSSYEYTDSSGARLRFEPISERGDRLVMLTATSPEDCRVVVDIDPVRVEEVVAGLRDTTRQASGPAPEPITMRLNFGEGDEHAIRNTIRQAARSGQLAGAPITDEQGARARADLPPGSVPTASALRAVMPRRFALLRHTDISGVSGTGLVADGVLWPDGTASVRWRGEHPSIVFWDRGQLSVDHVHGHGGATEIVWIDEP
ncbi:hypothetical protein ABT024_07050 [Streptomyces sp. NPDC002812]|uniref:hypothetical protein n=1 Tax=Streptomyces sp. NPDC002812 TaxID=3154434 RepID=UPI003319039B